MRNGDSGRRLTRVESTPLKRLFLRLAEQRRHLALDLLPHAQRPPEGRATLADNDGASRTALPTHPARCERFTDHRCHVAVPTTPETLDDERSLQRCPGRSLVTRPDGRRVAVSEGMVEGLRCGPTRLKVRPRVSVTLTALAHLTQRGGPPMQAHHATSEPPVDVLLVDPDVAVAQFLADVRPDLRVMAVPAWAAAMAALQRVAPALVVTELDFDEGSGEEICRAAKSLNPEFSCVGHDR